METREELDARLEKEYQEVLKSLEDSDTDDSNVDVDDDGKEDEVENPDDEGAKVDDDESDEGEADKDDEEPEDKKPGKRTKEEKKDYAFAQLRKEKSEAKRELDELSKNYKEQQEVLNRLMKEAGYENYKEFKEAIEEQLSLKEMKEKGYSKETYAELKKLQEENARIKQELDATRQHGYNEKVVQFDQLVKEYAKKTNTTSVYIYDELEKLGYTVDTLVAQPKPEVLIKGIVADKLTASVNKVKKTVDTDKPQSGGDKSSDEIDFDELIKKEMAEYKARKGKA